MMVTRWTLVAPMCSNYPCGLIARSTFNDSYIIDTKRIGSVVWERTNVTEVMS